jgi:four helix bundle protein
MKVNRFEDLEVWKNARELFKNIRRVSIDSPLAKDFSLKDQILRSSGSVMDNIAEGFERDGNKEFLQFLYISKGSLGETRSQIHRAHDCNYISKEEYENLINVCLNLSGQISHFIQYLKNSGFEGIKKK